MKKIQKLNSSDENIIYKKTVYSLKAEVNKNNLTKWGYFDLTKLENLRVVDNGFLKKIRKEYNKTQRELSRLIEVPLRTWIGWESYKKSVPFCKMALLSEKLNIKEEIWYGLVEDCYFNLGSHHGGDKAKLPLKPNNFILSKYLIPNGIFRAYVVKSCPEDIKKSIISRFIIDKTYFKRTGLITIYSYLLNRFLNTFYCYKKESILKFPLTSEINLWKSEGVDLRQSVIIPLLLTDGGEKPGNRLYCSGASKIIHDLWSDAWFSQYNLLPSSYLLRFKSIFVTTHIVKSEIIFELKKLCPNFKTSSGGETKERYLCGPQPSIRYLFDRSELEQQIAIRLWANTEGSIGISLSRKENLIRPSFKIACAHPKLVNELQHMSKLHKINLSVMKEGKNWSGIGGLKTTSIKSAFNFLRIGGFVKGTKIASQSKYFRGLDKQDVLLGVLEFILIQRENPVYKTQDINRIYKYIRNIVIKGEFKSPKYYLEKFRDFNNWSFRRLK